MPTIKSARRTRKAKPYKRRRGAKPLNRRQKYQVKKIVANTEETKSFDSYETLAVSTAGSMTDLSVIIQGDGVVNRDGNVINPVALRLFFYSQLSDATNVCRYIVFRWHEDDTFDGPATGDILANNMGGAYSWFNMTNYGQRKNFTILYDTVHQLDANRPQVFETKKIKLKKKIAFDTGVNSGKDHIYLLRISDSTTASHPAMSVYSRLYFKDP